jgi:hypothetical protein
MKCLKREPTGLLEHQGLRLGTNWSGVGMLLYLNAIQVLIFVIL